MAFVQGNGNISTGSTPTFTITFGSPVTPGSCVVVGVGTYNGGTHLPVGVTDDKGNVYHQSDQLADGPNGVVLTTYYLSNITNAPTILTVNMGTSNFFGAAAAGEYSGIVSLADPRDGHTINLQASPSTGTDALTSGNIITTVNGDTIWGYTINDNADGNVGAAGTGFAIRTTSIGGGWSLEDTVQTTAGTTAATFSIGVTDPYLTAVMALQAAPVPPPPGTYIELDT